MPRLLFHRDFTEYTGGHGKVFDYFRHALALGWDARVYLTPRSLRTASNPWMQYSQRIALQWRPEDADLLLLAGLDWQALREPQQPPCPVINLLQHVRHGWEGHPLRAFLSAPARRICVSQAVAESVLATGAVNGPLTVIPAALDLPDGLRRQPGAGHDTVLIAGLKAPLLAHALGDALRLRGVLAEVLDQPLPRLAYLQKVAEATLLVALPHPAEGFYLPALEAMALGVPVVTSDCLGSRAYTQAGENCVLAALEAPALVDAVLHALQPAIAAGLRAQGLATAAGFSQHRERAQFAQVLEMAA